MNHFTLVKIYQHNTIRLDFTLCSSSKDVAYMGQWVVDHLEHWKAQQSLSKASGLAYFEFVSGENNVAPKKRIKQQAGLAALLDSSSDSTLFMTCTTGLLQKEKKGKQSSESQLAHGTHSLRLSVLKQVTDNQQEQAGPQQKLTCIFHHSLSELTIEEEATSSGFNLTTSRGHGICFVCATALRPASKTTSTVYQCSTCEETEKKTTLYCLACSESVKISGTYKSHKPNQKPASNEKPVYGLLRTHARSLFVYADSTLVIKIAQPVEENAFHFAVLHADKTTSYLVVHEASLLHSTSTKTVIDVRQQKEANPESAMNAPTLPSCVQCSKLNDEITEQTVVEVLLASAASKQPVAQRRAEAFLSSNYHLVIEALKGASSSSFLFGGRNLFSVLLRVDVNMARRIIDKVFAVQNTAVSKVSLVRLSVCA